MQEDTKSRLVDAVRAELDNGRGVARREFERSAQEVREELDERTDEARGEVGARLVDLTEEYFPEEVARRRRRQAAAAFVAGVGAGAAARHVLGRD